MIPQLTGVIITYNGESLLKECLQSLSFCEKILVVDSFSTDKTREIAESFGAVFMQNPFVNTAEQLGFAFQNVETDWIVTLDQDEICSDELSLAIQDFFSNTASGRYTGAVVSRRTVFYGKFMKHSDWYPDRLLRLFLKNKVRIEVSGAHEEFHIEGETCILDADIIHYSYSSFFDQIEKLNKYAEAGAMALTAKGKKFSLLQALLHSFWAFFRMYFLKYGFLDGKAGFILATHHAFYVYMKYIRIEETEALWNKTQYK